MRRRRWLNDKTFVCKMLLVSDNRSALAPTPPDDLRQSPAGVRRHLRRAILGPTFAPALPSTAALRRSLLRFFLNRLLFLRRRRLLRRRALDLHRLRSRHGSHSRRVRRLCRRSRGVRLGLAVRRHNSDALGPGQQQVSRSHRHRRLNLQHRLPGRLRLRHALQAGLLAPLQLALAPGDPVAGRAQLELGGGARLARRGRAT